MGDNKLTPAICTLTFDPTFLGDLIPAWVAAAVKRKGHPHRPVVGVPFLRPPNPARLNHRWASAYDSGQVLTPSPADLAALLATSPSVIR